MKTDDANDDDDGDGYVMMLMMLLTMMMVMMMMTVTATCKIAAPTESPRILERSEIFFNSTSLGAS